MKIAEFINNYLKQQQIDTIFGYIGGYNADFLEYFCDDKSNKFVLNYHEQASAFAVNTYAELTDKVGVATASGAPSFCNLIPGIANAYFDSHACVFIAGSAHSLAIRTNKNLRQKAFEEIDMVSMVKDITKYAIKITNPNDIKYELEKSFYIASEGRKGPVLIDIPYDILRTDVDIDTLKSYVPTQNTYYDDIDYTSVYNMLCHSKLPVILVGGGTNNNKCRKLLSELTEKLQIPVVSSLCGLDVVAHDNKCFCGFVGHYGNRYANLALQNSDFILILGSRLDERQLGGFWTKFHPDTKIVRFDIDINELNKTSGNEFKYHSNVENFLSEFVKLDFSQCDYSRWLQCIKNWKMRYPSLDADKSNMSALNFINQLSDHLPNNAIICADVGQNQMSVAQALKLNGNRRLFNSAGYGSMGFSLPAAIGCAYAKKNTCIISFNGDGGIQMNLQELQTVKRDNLPINIIVLNNRCLGMIRKTQEKLFNGKDFVSVEGYSAPDFEAIANAYEIPYLKINKTEDYNLAAQFISSSHPTFIEVCLPMIMENNPEPGQKLDMQNPILSDTEFDEIRKECELYAK